MTSKSDRIEAVKRYLRDATPERIERYGERNLELAEWSDKNGHWLTNFFRQRVKQAPQALEDTLINECLRRWVANETRALLFLSTSGRVLFSNQSALSALRGTNLSIEKDRLVGVNERVTQELAEFLTGEAPGHVFRRDPVDPPLRVRRLPLFFHDSSESHQSLLLIELFIDLAPEIDTTVLQQWFGLSTAEANLAAAFAAGTSLQEFAEQRNVSITTVRTQFAKIKAKTGAEDQANVVRLLLQAQSGQFGLEPS